MTFILHPLLREKIRISGDMPQINITKMIDQEFQERFNNKLDCQLIREAELKNKECWYYESLGATL